MPLTHVLARMVGPCIGTEATCFWHVLVGLVGKAIRSQLCLAGLQTYMMAATVGLPQMGFSPPCLGSNSHCGDEQEGFALGRLRVSNGHRYLTRS